MNKLLCVLCALLMSTVLSCASSNDKPETDVEAVEGSGEGADVESAGEDDAVADTDSDLDGEEGAAAATPAKKSLYDRIGGQKTVDAFTAEFVQRLSTNKVIMSNPQVAAAMKKADIEKFKSHLRDQICEMAGGPCKYAGRPMKAAHAGMKISAEEWKALRKVFIRSLKVVNVPKAERVELATLAARTKPEIVGQ